MALKRRILRELLIAVLAATVGLVALQILAVLLHLARDSRDVGGPLLREVIRAWTRDYPGAWIVLGLLAAALSYPVRALLALRRRDDPASAVAGELRLLAALGATSSASFVASALSRAQYWRVAAPSTTAEIDFIFTVHLEREMAMWASLGAGLVLLAALWGVVGVAWTRRRSPGSAAWIVTIAGLAAAACVTGASLLGWWLELSDPYGTGEWIPPERRYAAIVDTGHPLIVGRLSLIAVALITAVGIVLAARRDRRPPASSRGLIASAGLFVLGLAMFGLTRGMAHDAAHPLPLSEVDGMTSLSETTVAALPRGQRCSFGVGDAPSLSVVGSAWMVDGVQGTSAADLGVILADKKRLWTQVTLQKPFPGMLHAAIRADAPMSLVSPFVEAARAAGYPRISVLEGLPPRTFVTRTMGEIAYRPRLCSVIAQPTGPLSTTGTWGDWASSLAAP